MEEASNVEDLLANLLSSDEEEEVGVLLTQQGSSP